MTVNRRRRTATRVGVVIAALVAVAVTLSGCGNGQFSQSLSGISATLSTYDQQGHQVDQIHGESFDISRDSQFDTQNSDGTSNNDSEVLQISLGNSHIEHVGSSLILAQDGLIDVTAQVPSKFRFSNSDPGTPWLNNLHDSFTRYWHSSSKTIVIRSQSGAPIKVYAGNNVKPLSTDVPKSTYFRITGPDGKARTLFVYRCDYTVVDNSLLKK
jgi:hypothetical protein